MSKVKYGASRSRLARTNAKKQKRQIKQQKKAERAAIRFGEPLEKGTAK